MKQRAVCLALAALLPVLARGTRFRSQAKAVEQVAPLGPQEIVKLLVDIDESVRKAAEDEELVFATLVAYDQQLQASLGREMGTLNKTLTKLTSIRTILGSELGASRTQLTKLDKQAQGSAETAKNYEAGTAEAGQKFDQLLGSVNALISLLEAAKLTPEGTLIARGMPTVGGSSRMYRAIRRLLKANRPFQSQFKDVFDSFLQSPPPPATAAPPASKEGDVALMVPPPVFTQVHMHTAVMQVPAELRHAPAIHMTPTLLGRTVQVLKAIHLKVSRQRAKALLQLGNWQQKLRAEAVSAKANVDMEQGVEAEKEQKAEELSFSTTFTEAVWKLDEDFRSKMSKSMQFKAEMVEQIRDARAKQLKTLKDLIDLLQGKYSVDDKRPAEADHDADGAVDSFFQMTSLVHLPRVSNLQFEIETALHNKKDTHNILLRIRDMLDRSAPVDAGSVQGVAVQMGTALRDLNWAQSKEGDAKIRCESQNVRAQEESQGLKANLALMSAVHNNTLQAIAAAKGNLKGIAAKTHALERLANDFAKMVAQAMHTLEGQSQDRGTIMVAVQKAGEIAVGIADKSAVTAFLEQILQQLEAQEQQERQYRAEQSAFRARFLIYVRDYLQLLKERRGHYESSLSALELYSNEVANDLAVQHGSLEASKDLEREDKDLCDSILRFYGFHNKRREDLKHALQVVLPQLPDIVGLGVDGTDVPSMVGGQ